MHHEPWIDDEPDGRLRNAHPELMAEIARLLPELDPDRQLLVAALVTETCPYCYRRAVRDCWCMRDD